ncbi:GM18932 [Drosophila sechellia]|uniref:GM18932 n=1 Tax=Drosophila sechellia TaxID=7238 RepID=B4I9L9_DROSE|nr:GM18932 [Drosophila sechellia]
MDEMPSRFSSTSPDSEDSREQSTSTASTEEDESPYRQSLRREKRILASSPLSMEERFHKQMHRTKKTTITTNLKMLLLYLGLVLVPVILHMGPQIEFPVQ